MPRMKDVARRAGVGVMTVSRVINNSGYVSAETRARVEAAIAELNYKPNALARGLRSSRTNTLAFVIGDIVNPFWGIVIKGAQQVAREAGFHLIFCNTGNSFAEQREYLELVVQRQVDGILMTPLPGNRQIVHWLREREIPLVAIDSRIEGEAVDTVRCDSEQGAYEMTRLLIQWGHQRIALLSGPLSFWAMRVRVDGYLRALKEAGLSGEERIFSGAFEGASGYQMAHDALAQAGERPTALFATSNYLGWGALRYVRDQGMRVPEDITVTSFDELPAELFFDPFLTLVSQPAFEMGRQAVELMLERVNAEQSGEPREVVLPIEIIVRSSSGPVPGA